MYVNATIYVLFNVLKEKLDAFMVCDLLLVRVLIIIKCPDFFLFSLSTIVKMQSSGAERTRARPSPTPT